MNTPKVESRFSVGDERKRKIVTLKKQGVKIRNIAKRLQVSLGTVTRVLYGKHRHDG